MPRLVDIMVTEVSLVTKAANKRKFLLFKSSGESQMDGQHLEPLRKAIEELGTKVNSLIEQPKSEESVSVVKALDGFVKSIEKAFGSAEADLKSAIAKAESLEKQVGDLTKERDELKAKLDESAGQVSDEVMALVDEVSKAIPSEEDVQSLVKECIEKVTGIKSE